MLLYIMASWQTITIIDQQPSIQALFRRGQLKALVDLHSTTEGMGGYLAEEEINVIRGALDLTGKQATVAMTPLEKVRLAVMVNLNASAGCYYHIKLAK